MQELLLVFILLLGVLTLLGALGGSLRFQEGFFEEEIGKQAAAAAAAATPYVPETFEENAEAAAAAQEAFRATPRRRRNAREQFEDGDAGVVAEEGFRAKYPTDRERFEGPAVEEPFGGQPSRRPRQHERFEGDSVQVEPMASNDEEGFIEPFENAGMLGGCSAGSCAAF